LTAVRDGGRLRLYIDGKLVKESEAFQAADFDLSTDQPLRIGFGQSDYFSGKMAEVRVYDRALSEDEIKKLASQRVN
jgi:hypothetical protein